MKSDGKIVGITFLSMFFFWGGLIPLKRYQNTPGHGAELGVYNNHLIKFTEI